MQLVIEWIECLCVVDIVVVICDNIDVLRVENVCIVDGMFGIDKGSYLFFIYFDYLSGYEIIQFDFYVVRLVWGRVFVVELFEKFGVFICSILCELGYLDCSIDLMLKFGVLSESWSEEYLLS